MIKLNAILYYADFLSMKDTGLPVTDTCKYFFIHGTPINACYIADVEPIYDPDNQYFKQSREEYERLENKFGEQATLSFVDGICNLSACGSVDGERMLRFIHQYNGKREFENALAKYNKWKKDLIFQHIIKDEDGKERWAECTKAIAHSEKTEGYSINSSMYQSGTENKGNAEEIIEKTI